jgi:hypothetical protein
VRRLACLGIIGAMKATPTVAVKVFLGPLPLHLQLEAPAKAGVYRLSCSNQCKPKSECLEHACIIQNMKKDPICGIGTNKKTKQKKQKQTNSVALSLRANYTN